MAYYTGTVNTMTALRQALIDACLLEGWAWNGSTEVLSKGALYLRLQIVSGYLTLLGRTSATAGDAPNVVRIGKVHSAIPDIAWPATYEIFAFAGEVYLVLNYAVDYYQWCAFGQSSVAGLPGSGMWFGATLKDVNFTNGAGPIYIHDAGGGQATNTTAALFWESVRSGNDWCHSDLDGQGWWSAQTLAGAPVGIRHLTPLPALLPNTWNSEAVLLPIRACKVRPSNRISIVADLEHARTTRIDNYAPGQVITIGSDRWKIFPWYRKVAAERNAGTVGGTHTGTFGWAIRYEGP